MTNRKELFRLGQPSPTATDSAARQTAISLPNGDPSSAITDGGRTESRVNYKTHGLIVAGACQGALAALKPSLVSIIETIKKHLISDQKKQEQYKQGIREQIVEKEAELKSKDALIQIYQDKIAQLRQTISDIKDKIAHVKAHPEDYDADRINKVYVWIGGILLTFLTIYLFIFYSSASYSAFFKSFTHDDDKVSQAIFDAQALSAAWEMGATALFFILLIPFVFLGLGFLIHRFQERGERLGILKSITIIAITFVFDAFLAYDITEKIYEIKRGGSFEELPPYSIPMALENINFWVIIFAGFLVYLIWGFVFDFTINAYQSLDKWQLEIQRLKEQVENTEVSIRNEQEGIHTHNVEKATINQDIAGLKVKLGQVYIDKIVLANELSNFFDGWLVFVANHSPREIDSHKQVYEEVKKEEGIA